jgi:hypothetical protein
VFLVQKKLITKHQAAILLRYLCVLKKGIDPFLLAVFRDDFVYLLLVIRRIWFFIRVKGEILFRHCGFGLLMPVLPNNLRFSIFTDVQVDS